MENLSIRFHTILYTMYDEMSGYMESLLYLLTYALSLTYASLIYPQRQYGGYCLHPPLEDRMLALVPILVHGTLKV